MSIKGERGTARAVGLNDRRELKRKEIAELAAAIRLSGFVSIRRSAPGLGLRPSTLHHILKWSERYKGDGLRWRTIKPMIRRSQPPLVQIVLDRIIRRKLAELDEAESGPGASLRKPTSF